MNSYSPFSPHKDVLEAPIPDDEAGQARLLEELKNRGRSAVQASIWPDAHALYEKALQVCEKQSTKDNAQEAIINANNSLVLGKMNRWAEAKTSAKKAVELDASYTKGFWRLGQASGSLGDFDEATKAMNQAIQLEPKNKALQKELKNLEVKAREAAEKKALEEEKKKKEAAEPMLPPLPTTKVAKDASSKSSEGEPMEIEADGTTFTKSEHVKGYKIVNGKKTSYFHNELSEEAKKLIGDIAPKKLEASQQPQSSEPAEKGTSAWNKAGTWEERDLTKWACDSLKEQLEKVAYTFPNSSPAPGATVTTSKATVTGHASVATVRGKKRYIYEMIVKLEWAFEHEDVDANGKLNLPDVDGTCQLGEGYEATNWEVSHATNATLRPMLDQFIHKQGWRNAVHDAIDDWVRSFKETY